MAKNRRRGTGSATKRRGNRVLIYIRVSALMGRKQGEDLISDEVQLAECMRVVRSEGLEVVGEPIIELDKTGKTFDKRRIGEIIDKVDRKEIDGVVVWKVSRWGRTTIDSMLNIGELQEAGGFILSATENLNDIDTPAGKFSLTVLLAIAQMYSDEIGKTWQNIHDYRRDNGKTHNGSPRLGYLYLKNILEEEHHQYNVVEGSDYVVDPVKGPWVRDAYERYALKGESLLSVVRDMDVAGIRSTRGKRITYKSLLSTLDGGFAAGLIVDRRGEEEVFQPGNHEPLISMETWEKYRARRSEQVAPRDKAPAYRVAKLLNCAGCGSRMIVSWRYRNGHRHRYFRCGRIQKTTRSALCPAPAQVQEAKVERILLEWLRANVEGEGAMKTAMARQQAAQMAVVDVARIEKDIKRVERRMSVLYDDYSDGTITKEVYKIKAAELEADRERLRESRTARAVDVEVNNLPQMDAFGALLAGWEHLPPEVVNKGLRAVVREIRVAKNSEHMGPSLVRIIGAWEEDRPALKAV